jgi:ABC-type nitrate/sulfonate/bicarbonate transport system substrate-binding protein
MKRLQLTPAPQSSGLRETVSQTRKCQGCHSERSEESRPISSLHKARSFGLRLRMTLRDSLKGGELNAVSLRVICWLIAALFALVVPQRSDAQPRDKVRVALGSISVNTSVIPVGHQYGLFAKYGVDLEPIYMGGGMNSLAAVTSNTVQFLSAGSTATISARLGGIDIAMLTVQSNKLDYSVFAAPEIKSPQDLKGKIVTGTRPGASADSALRLYLRRAGLVPDKV